MSKAVVDSPAGFAAIVGEAHVTTDPAACATCEVDGVRPRCVVYPTTTEETAEVLKRCSNSELAVIPCGNGTKLGLGATPRRYDVALCLNRMKRVVYYEPDDLVISVEPGVGFAELQRLLSQRRLWVPLDPAVQERATVGGITGANSAGPLRLRYGSARDLVLGMKIVTADGAVVKTGGRVVKNVAGYDLGKLLIGSCGTLGVVVEITFKLHPQVRQRMTWALGIGSAAAARDFRRRLLGSPLRPLRAVLLNRTARDLLGVGSAGQSDEPGAVILIEAGGSERILARYEAELKKLAGAQNAPLRLVEAEAAADGWARVADFALAYEKQAPVALKAALPIAAAEDYLERAEKDAQAEGCKVAALAQLGVGVVELGLLAGGWQIDRAAGGTSVRSSVTDSELRAPSPGLIGRLRQSVAGLGGSLVVTRCPAGFKSTIDVWGPPCDDFEVMRKLKAAWDPRNTLAPGRFVGGI